VVKLIRCQLTIDIAVPTVSQRGKVHLSVLDHMRFEDSTSFVYYLSTLAVASRCQYAEFTNIRGFRTQAEAKRAGFEYLERFIMSGAVILHWAVDCPLRDRDGQRVKKEGSH